MARRQRVSWHDLPPARRRDIIIAGTVQAVLALSAWRDLARRPVAQVNGPKQLWALAIAVNIVGPIAYFRWGRRP